MLVYAIYNRNVSHSPAWEQAWYGPEGDFYLGTGWPKNISAGYSEDLKGKMSRAFILAATREEQERAAADPDIKILNELLSQKEPGRAAKKRIAELRRTLGERYSQPAVKPGETLYAAQDDRYEERAMEEQEWVHHTVATTMLGAVFTNEAAAKSYSYCPREYRLTEDEGFLTVLTNRLLNALKLEL